MLRIAMDLEIFIWAIVGGLFLALLGGSASYYKNEKPTVKQLSRDFIIGAAVTGVLFPVLPENLSDVKESLPVLNAGPPPGLDPGVQVGPANF